MSVSYVIAVYSTVKLYQPFPVVELSQQAITAIMGEVGVAAAVHPLGVLGIGHAQLPLVAVLEVVGPQARLCVEVPHQAGGASVGEPLPLQVAPDSLKVVENIFEHNEGVVFGQSRIKDDPPDEGEEEGGVG